MAKSLYKKKNLVGKAVYEAYRPQMPGIIVADLGEVVLPHPLVDRCPGLTDKGRGVKVKWLNGNESICNILHLNDFQALIDDHLKKGQKHTEMLEKLKESVATTIEK